MGLRRVGGANDANVTGWADAQQLQSSVTPRYPRSVLSIASLLQKSSTADGATAAS
ncbi:MAG: hypothetical protein OTI36_20975 [Beijerinckiaceae bacterium]|nr:hypothetical protein [Beijerinckiaceae bacterium]